MPSDFPPKPVHVRAELTFSEVARGTEKNIGSEKNRREEESREGGDNGGREKNFVG